MCLQWDNICILAVTALPFYGIEDEKIFCRSVSQLCSPESLSDNRGGILDSLFRFCSLKTLSQNVTDERE